MALSKFCRLELMTSNAAAALAFYGPLFGWRADQQSGSGEALDPETYVWVRDQAGRQLGGLYTMTPDLQKQGVAPHWLPQLQVPDANAQVTAARASGAKVMTESFSLFERGHLALLQDPSGAPFGLWQPSTKEPLPGFWCELSTHAIDKAVTFYQSFAGWQLDADDDAKSAYHLMLSGKTQVAAVLRIDPRFKAIPAHWLVYQTVDDIDATCKQVAKLGGRLLAEPNANAAGTAQAVARDPQGAVFGLIESEKD